MNLRVSVLEGLRVCGLLILWFLNDHGLNSEVAASISQIMSNCERNFVCDFNTLYSMKFLLRA